MLTSGLLLQSAVPSLRSTASTFTLTSQMLAATEMGTCRVTWLPLSTSPTKVTLTSPPVTTGPAAAAGRAGTAIAPVAAVAIRAVE